jgi:transaldolase
VSEPAPKASDLKVKIFADGADFDGIMHMAANPLIKGFTTNPTLMRKAGISDYAAFAKRLVAAIPDRPIALEVFADDVPTMEAQAYEIASWGSNVNVKIPVTTTDGASMAPLVKRLSAAGVWVNVTAVMTFDQITAIADVLDPAAPAIISVFAGRVADTGRDPIPLMAHAVNILAPLPKAEVIWASPRELLNVFQADAVGCHIITATNDILAKLAMIGKDLSTYSLETVSMFRNDALAAGFTIKTAGA